MQELNQFFRSSKQTHFVDILQDETNRVREQLCSTNNTRSGTVTILIIVGTDPIRGLNIPGVSRVINYDLPKNVDEYLVQIGRCGRIGNPGLAVSYFDPVEDRHKARGYFDVS
jgi:superfamily II DNA/RNA helicase